MIRLKRDQEKRCSLYCLGEHHVSITDPIYPYSGEWHQIELSACDCPKAENVESPPPDVA